MSAASGIKVSSGVTDAFASAVAQPTNVRALLLLIEGEEFQHKSTIAPKGTYKEDIALLPPSLPTPTSCASWVYRTDTRDGSGGWEWMMVTFVPDGAGVRQKMLQASSRAGLMKSLGEGKFKDNLFATSLNDLTTASFTSHINHMSSPPPLTASEKALADVKAAEAEESRREQLGGAQRRGNAVVPVKMKWSEELVSALKGLNEPVGGDEQGKIVCVQIEPKTETLTLLLSKTISTAEIPKTLPPSAPCFTFFSWPGSGATAPAPAPAPAAPVAVEQPAEEKNEDESATEDKSEGETKHEEASPVAASPLSASKAEPPKIVFIYTCPSSSPVRHRMLYSSSVQFVIKESESQTGVVVSKKLETSDLDDLTPNYIRSELFPPKQASSMSSFSRPTVKTSGFPAQTGARPFGAPMPVRSATASTASQIPLPPTPTGSVNVNNANNGAEEEDRKEAIAKAFNAFGPRVGSPAGGPGFARPKPAGRR